MKKIVLHVDDKHTQTVMGILANLKEGLIDSIESEGSKRVRESKYAPKQGKAIDEREKPAGKYVSAAQYKSRLKK